MSRVTSRHEDVDSCLPGVAGVAGVVALVPWPGGRDGEETLRPVLVPPHTDGPGGVVVDHLLVLVPEDVPRLNSSHRHQTNMILTEETGYVSPWE